METYLPQSRIKKLVNDLRDEGLPGDIKVYHANPDGSRGELIKIIPYKDYQSTFQNRHKYNGGRKDAVRVGKKALPSLR